MNHTPSIAKCLYSLILLQSCFVFANNKTSFAHQSDTKDSIPTYANPVIGADLPDPSVVRVGKTYYASGTSSEYAPYFPWYTSTDLVNWQQKGYVFDKKPEWAKSSFWAPEIFYHNQTFYVYYVAKRASDNVGVIAVATSKDPAKGFTDHGVIIDQGTECIDPFVIEDKGQLYITWKAYGLDNRPIELLCRKLSKDGLKPEGETFSLLKDDERKGMEGGYMIKHNNYYYLFYSAGNCCGVGCDYNMRVARGTNILGPYTKYEGNPILANNEKWKCPGHGTMVQSADNKFYFLYHAYSVKDDVYTGRIGMLDELAWDAKTGWPFFRKGTSPSIESPLPAAAKPQATSQMLSDSFTTNTLQPFWQWDFRHYAPVVAIADHRLSLSGAVDSSNHTGVVLTVRPASASYTISAEIANTNKALKGLVIYGDVDQSLGIGIADNLVQVWKVTDGKKSTLASAQATAQILQLKIQVTNKTAYAFFWKKTGENWQPFNVDPQSFSNDPILPPWDRSARPGIMQYGDSSEVAQFNWFTISY